MVFFLKHCSKYDRVAPAGAIFFAPFASIVQVTDGRTIVLHASVHNAIYGSRCRIEIALWPICQCNDWSIRYIDDPLRHFSCPYAEILDHTITVGTQVKTDIPGKGAVVAMVDSIETPIVLLKNGDVIKIRNALHGKEVRTQIEKILYLGDVLISFGDFLENNAKMMPTGYVEEYWIEELRLKDADLAVKYARITPTLDHALDMCSKLGMALHPKYLHYWDQLDKNDLRNPSLSDRIRSAKDSF